jgi:hypothetical protein
MNRYAHVALARIWMYGSISFICLGVILVLVGGYVIVAQVILWLKSGQWVSLPLLYLFINPWPLLTDKFSADAAVAIQRATGSFSDPLFILRMGLHTYFNGLPSWLLEPKEWVGVQKIVRGILELVPVSLFFLGLGAAVWIPAKECLTSAEEALEELSKEPK